jgi:hypothetical protein
MCSQLEGHTALGKRPHLLGPRPGKPRLRQACRRNVWGAGRGGKETQSVSPLCTCCLALSLLRLWRGRGVERNSQPKLQHVTVPTPGSSTYHQHGT